jgi:hypothetical protein
MPFLKQITVSGGMIPCWLVTTDVKNDLDVSKPVSYEEIQYVNAILLISFPEPLQSDPDKNTSVVILWYKFGANIESETVKLISLHSNVSLKIKHTHTHTHTHKTKAKYYIYYLTLWCVILVVCVK